MKVLHLIGRILFGLLFVFNGLNHFMQLDALTQYAASQGVPMPQVAVIVTGAMILLGGLSIIFGYQRKVGLWLLIVFLIPTSLIMHQFWALEGQQAQTQMAHFLKNLSLAGAALALLLFADRDWPFSLGGSTAEPGAGPG